MELKYNNIILSKADNIQDLTIDFIYQRIGLFIGKPEFFYNEIIPNTLRGFHELMSCFKNENSDNLDKFTKYICHRICAEFDNHKINFFNRLEISDDRIFNIILLNGFLDLIKDSDEEIQNYFLKARNPHNISISDIILCFDFVEENIDINDFTSKRFLNYLKIYVSLRYLKASFFIESNLLRGGLVNDYNEIFPRVQADSQRRDYVEFDLKIFQNELIDVDKFWLSTFLPIIGKYNLDYRLTEERIFERNQRNWRLYDNAVFSPIFPIVSIFILDLDNNYTNDSKTNELIHQCKIWRNENYELKTIFTNIQFVDEFLKKFNSFAVNYREPHISYSKTIYDYLFIGIPECFNELRSKYKFLLSLDDELILENPIFQYWRENEGFYSSIIDLVYKNRSSDFSYNKNTVDIAIFALDKYSRYFDKSNRNTSQGTKQAMNFLVKLFEKDPEVFKDLKRFRNQMDKQFNNGLTNIHSLLLKIANG